MPGQDDIEELDKLIDRAVDTLFVEMPSDEEQGDLDAIVQGASQKTESTPEPVPSLGPPKSEPPPGPISFDSFDDTDLGEPRKSVSSGDADMDRAIDLAVDTLFVEEPEAPIPETTAVEVKLETIVATRRPARGAEPSAEISRAPSSEYIDVEVVTEATSGAETVNYEEVMAEEIDRNLESLFQEAVQPQPRPLKPVAKKDAKKAADVPALRKMQEAILTLEWEISPRSIAVLSDEIRRLRSKFHEDVTVEFACISMRLVLDYVSRRASKAHPESIRFLLAVSGLIHRTLTSLNEDPLDAFHQILTRYESFKSLVRKAEGLPDSASPRLQNLKIKDPEAFSRLVEMQAMTLLKAGKSLAQRMTATQDAKNLIRSFRFLVTRSVNRILTSTHEDIPKTITGKAGGKR